MRRLSWLATLSIGCGPQNGDGTSADEGSGGDSSETEATASESATTTATSTDPTSATLATAGSDGDSSDAGGEACEGATTADACAALGDPCAWHETMVAMFDGVSCTSQAAGVCIGDQSGVICDLAPTCGSHYWWHRPADEGFVELLELDHATGCGENPTGHGFEPCTLVQANPPMYEPSACGCACA